MKARKEIKGYKKGGKVKAKKVSKPKVRGAGKVMKGVRPAKMVEDEGRVMRKYYRKDGCGYSMYSSWR